MGERENADNGVIPRLDLEDLAREIEAGAIAIERFISLWSEAPHDEDSAEDGAN